MNSDAHDLSDSVRLGSAHLQVIAPGVLRLRAPGRGVPRRCSGGSWISQMDAAVAALIGAGTGSFATLIGHALQIWRDDRHQSRALGDARRARLLDRRLAAHQVLYSILWKKIDYTEASSIDPDYPVSRKAMWAALDVVQVVSAPATSDAAEAVVRSVSELEKQIADGATVSVATVQPIRSAAQDYRRALLKEVGAQD